MIELKGNLFKPSTYKIMNPPTRGWIPANMKPDAICITTNGFVKSNGQSVMGRGCAKQASQYFPPVALALGHKNKVHGNRVHQLVRVRLEKEMATLFSFPVKSEKEICTATKSNVVQHMKSKFKPGEWVPGWACRAREDLIIESSQQLVKQASLIHCEKVILPRPGCGAGELEWNNIKEILAEVLDDRFYCISY